MDTSRSTAVAHVNVNKPAGCTDLERESFYHSSLLLSPLPSNATPHEVLNAFTDAADALKVKDGARAVEDSWWLYGVGLRLAGLPLTACYVDVLSFEHEYQSDVIAGWLLSHPCEKCGSTSSLRYSLSHPRPYMLFSESLWLWFERSDAAMVLEICTPPRGPQGRILCSCEWCECNQSKARQRETCRDCEPSTE